jgi:rare lipoprotein A (peptidoglycan hydrolase)
MMLAIVSAVVIAAAQSAEGVANFSGDKFQGKKTASGDVFDKDGLTASHKKLPFGTKVKVTNVENGKRVVSPSTIGWPRPIRPSSTSRDGRRRSSAS